MHSRAVSSRESWETGAAGVTQAALNLLIDFCYNFLAGSTIKSQIGGGMSRFIDSLRKFSAAAAPPMGFRATRDIAKPRLLLVASLSQPGFEAELSSADAGMVAISGLKEKAPALADIPWGGWLDSISRGDMKGVEQAGYDFVVFPADKMTLAVLEADKVGRIVAVDAMLDAGLLRTINELPLDAVFVTGQRPVQPITWHQLMLFSRLADLVTKPLLVPLPIASTTDELQTLWQVGVDGVVVEPAPDDPARGVKKLRQQIEKLAPPSRHKPTKARALLPGVAPEPSPGIEEDEEE